MKRVIGLIVCLLALVLLGVSVVPDAPKEGETLSLYFPVRKDHLSSGGDAIAAVRLDWRQMRDKSSQEQAEAVMDLLLEGYSDAALNQLVPNGTRLNSCQVSGSTVTVDFSGGYGQLSGIDLTIADYCTTLSLVQIPGIYTVRITVNGEGLDYRAKNYFRADDVLVTSPEDVVRNLAVRLYFSNGSALVEEERILTVYEGKSQVSAVMDALLQGPVSETLLPLLPEGFSVLSARIDGGICYLNLSQECVGLMPEDIASQQQIVQGLVRSLCSIRTVQRVQILIEGERCARLAKVDISQPLTPAS